MTDDRHTGVSRRGILGAVAGAGAGSLAGCSLLESGEDAPTSEISGDGGNEGEDGNGGGEAARSLATEYAPVLYFDEHERWFPTDPRPYRNERDGETVVDGFDALEGYAERSGKGDAPPNPTVFYHAVEYAESSLAAVQYWMYSTFDQFTTNFHWHDWEVLTVFVDTEAGEPRLYVASSHSRKVPNNEFLDPDPDRVPRVLSELGSHSSALSLNEEHDHFLRLPTGDVLADITNSAIEGVGDLAEIPAAYGLPRDEGSRLPYVVPELDGAPVYEHERLPTVDRSDLIDESLTVRSFDALSSPPTDLPDRETGVVLGPTGDGSTQDGDADATYELVPTSELEGIEAFVGPQLSFEFAVPSFAEDAIASHITTTSTPWKQPRYDDPAADISDPNHRAALADDYNAIGEPAPVNSLLVGITEAITTDEAPEDEGLTTQESAIESILLLESEPEAVPTFRGLGVVQDVPEGDHRLTVNGAGLAPHAEPVTVDGDAGPTLAGVGGEVPLVARERAAKLEVDSRGADAELESLAVEDDFAGRLYDAPLLGPDAVYVHRGGAYTTEVRDAADEIGAFRVNPGDEDRVRIDEPRTGKAPLATYLADVAEETRTAVLEVADDDGDTDDDDDDRSGDGPGNAIRGLARALAAVAEAARRAAERAEAGDRANADQSLEAVATRLDRVAERLAAARDGLPGGLARATDQRLNQARRRTDQAREAQKL